MGIHFFHILGIVWISALIKIVEKPLLWNVCFFPYFSRIMEIHFSQVLGIVWISASSKIFKKPINLKCLCFPILFLYNGNPFFPCFGNCLDFWLKRKISETLNFWNVCVLSYFSLAMGIHFFHNLGIVWISDSPKKFKKPVNVKCLYFPILFPYYGNPLFPCVGNCMDFCFKQKIPETLNLCFPTFFPYCGNALFSYFGNYMY